MFKVGDIVKVDLWFSNEPILVQVIHEDRLAGGIRVRRIDGKDEYFCFYYEVYIPEKLELALK